MALLARLSTELLLTGRLPCYTLAQMAMPVRRMGAVIERENVHDTSADHPIRNAVSLDGTACAIPIPGEASTADPPRTPPYGEGRSAVYAFAFIQLAHEPHLMSPLAYIASGA
jgi:hypothetical protein